MTQNYDDYWLLQFAHEGQGQSPRHLVIRQENDPTRDLTPKVSWRCFANWKMASAPVENEYIIPNHWR